VNVVGSTIDAVSFAFLFPRPPKYASNSDFKSGLISGAGLGCGTAYPQLALWDTDMPPAAQAG